MIFAIFERTDPTSYTDKEGHKTFKTRLIKNVFSIAGMLYNLTESYDCAFYLAASLFLIAGAVMSLPVLKFHKPNKDGSNYATTSDIEVYSRSTSSIETQTFVEDLIED